MKVKKLYKYLMISIGALLLGSCTSTEVDPKFDQNATERLSGRKKELNDLLLSSAEGWKAVYYTDSTQLGGWTHLMKFLPEGKVDMASDFTTDAGTDTGTYRSQYEIQMGSTVSLVFTTQNRIHLLSDAGNYPTAALLAKGYLGDFQFYYYGQKNGDIIFKTNRNGHMLHFVKATAQDWTDLAKNKPMIANLTGDMFSPLFRIMETNDGAATHQFEFDYNAKARFGTAYSLEPGSQEAYDLAFAYTPTGVVSKLPVKVKGQELTNFVYDAATNNFVAKGTNGVTATIKFTNSPPTLTDDYKLFLSGKGNPYKYFGYLPAFLSSAPTTSDYFKYLAARANAGLPANQSIASIYLYFNTAANQTYISYNFNGGKAAMIHVVKSSEDAVNKTIILTHDFWAGGITGTPAYLKEIDDQFTNSKGLYVKKESFKIQYSNVIYSFASASSSFRISAYIIN